MSSKVDIANQGLTLLGGGRITSFADGTTEANTMNVWYEPSKAWLLRAYPWNKASQRVLLAENAEPPINEFKFSYKRPTKSIRIFRIYDGNNRNTDWKVEGPDILTNAKPAIAQYAFTIDEGDFDPHMEAALAHLLALRSAYAITGSNTVVTNMGNLFNSVLDEARTTDALEASSERISADTLAQVRQAGSHNLVQYSQLDQTGINQPK